MIDDTTGEMVLRQIIRETLMVEYKYKWGDAKSIEQGKGSVYSRPRSSSSSGGLGSIPSAISNTAVAKKVRSVLSSSSKVLTAPLGWLNRTFRRAPVSKLAKYGIGSVAGIGVVTTLYDFFAHDGKPVEEAREAEQACSRVIEDNRAVIQDTTFITKLPNFTINFDTLEPSAAKTDLSKIIAEIDIPGRIRRLSEVLSSEDINSVSGVADTTLTLEEPNLSGDSVVQARALKVVVDAAVIDMSAALENELTNFFAALKDNVDSISNPEKKSAMLEVFRQLDTEITNSLSLAQYLDLEDLLSPT